MDCLWTGAGGMFGKGQQAIAGLYDPVADGWELSILPTARLRSCLCPIFTTPAQDPLRVCICLPLPGRCCKERTSRPWTSSGRMRTGWSSSMVLGLDGANDQTSARLCCPIGRADLEPEAV